MAATARPAKFPETVEPLLGRHIKPPRSLAALLGRPSRKIRIDAWIDALAAELRKAALTH